MSEPKWTPAQRAAIEDRGGALLVSAAAAGTIFPAEYTDIDGVTRAGYLDEEGMTVLPFAYAQAGDFADCGLAAVEI